MSELALWRAVITQAFADACPKVKGSDASAARVIALERARARNWLTGMSRDFVSVCNLAELEPEAVRALAIERFGSTDSPVESGSPQPRIRPEARAQRRSLSPRPEIRRSGTRYDHNGLSMTISQWSGHLGIGVPTLRHRLRAGWPIDKVFSGLSVTKTYDHNGQSLTLKQWSDRLGVPLPTLNGRMRARWSIDRVFSSDRHGKRRG